MTRGAASDLAVMAALAATLFAAPVKARAEAPVLARYVTDENADAFVAIYGGAAVALEGCENVEAAKQVLALPGAAQLEETTFDVLSQSAGLGTHPGIPCMPGPLDEAAWPADAALWADLPEGGRYLLKSPEGLGFYAVDAGCEALKTALQIRARTQRTGVFQGFGVPDPLELRLTIGCGPGVGGDGPNGPEPSEASLETAGWMLHRTELFLSETGLPETLFVLSGPTETGRGYLPVLRLDGQEIAPLFLAGGAALADAELSLRALVGVATATPVTQLDLEAQGAVQRALFVDLCTSDCDGYRHQHGHFATPDFDVVLSLENAVPQKASLGLLGRPIAGITYGGGRSLLLSGCPELAAALGLSIAQTGDNWPVLMAEAQQRAATPRVQGRAEALRCEVAPEALCVRRVDGNGQILPGHLAATGDCTNKKRLRLLLPETALAAQPLALGPGQGFDTVEIAPAPGHARTILTLPADISAQNSPCLAAPPRAMIHVFGGVSLDLRRLTLRQKQSAAPRQAIGIHMDGGTLVTDGVTMAEDADAGAPPERGISLCTGEYYARATRVHASELALQGSAARLALSGTPDGPTTFTSTRFALAASAGTEVQMHSVSLAARTTVTLFNATVRGAHVTLSADVPLAPSSVGVQLRGASLAELMQSTAQGFACVGSFWTPGSTALFTLPGNALARDNTRLSCGSGAVTLLE